MGSSAQAERAFGLRGLGRMVRSSKRVVELINVSCWAPLADLPELN